MSSEVKVNSSGRDDLSALVDRLTAVFRACNIDVKEGEQHPAGPMVGEVWSVLSALTTKFQSDQKIIERICRLVRLALVLMLELALGLGL